MAGQVSDRAIEEIRARIDIVELIAARGVTLKRAGASFKGCCPFHNEKTPSFHVNPVRRFYHCFGCQEHGDIFSFLMKQDGLSFIEAVRSLAEKAGVVIDTEVDYEAESRTLLYAIHLELAAFYQRCLAQTAEAAPARAYLASRQLSDDIIKRFNLGYAPRRRGTLLKWAAKHTFTAEQLVTAGILAPSNNPAQPEDYYDRFRGRLMFPIADPQGRVVAFSGRILDPKAHPAKYVNSPETPVFRKGAILYAFDKARSVIVKHPRREAVICEGQIDVIRCHAAGIDTAVASQGTAFTREHVDLLKRQADSAVLLFDGDTAGHKAAIRTGVLFLEAGIPVRVASLPPGEDPDSLIRDKGGDAVRGLIDAAESLTAFQIRSMQTAEERPDGVDAVSRVSRAVIESLATCTNAVLRSHLLQEAAVKLHLPEAALSEDLEVVRQQQAEAAARAKTLGKTSAPSVPHRAPAPVEESPPLQDPFSGEQSETEPVAESMSRAVSAPPSAAEHALAELLFHYEDDPDIGALLCAFLPKAVVLHTHVRALFHAWLDARETGRDALADLYATANAELRAFLDPVIVHRPRVVPSEDVAPLDAACDLVACLWVEALRTERAAIERQTSADARMRRLVLTQRIKTLQQATQEAERLTAAGMRQSVSSWSLREPVIREELARLTQAKEQPETGGSSQNCCTQG